MISNRFKILFLSIVLIFSIKYTAAASTESEDTIKDTIIEYDITEKSTEEFVDTEKTSLEINTDKRYIRLSKEDVAGKIKFINEDNSPVAYSVMTGNGVTQYAFDGEKW